MGTLGHCQGREHADGDLGGRAGQARGGGEVQIPGMKGMVVGKGTIAERMGRVSSVGLMGVKQL